MKLAKSILLIIAFVLSTSFVRESIGQETKIDVLYLQNGSIINGSIIELEPGVLVKIQTRDGSIFVYEMSEVKKITKEVVKQSFRISQDRKISTHKAIGRNGLLYSWVATVAGSAIMGDEMIGTTIIPVLGPFVTIIRVEGEPNPTYLPGGKELLYLSGVIQTSFCIYYLTTLLKESHSQRQYGFKVQPTARSLGMKLSYTF